jgi:hypothetical protein
MNSKSTSEREVTMKNIILILVVALIPLIMGCNRNTPAQDTAPAVSDDQTRTLAIQRITEENMPDSTAIEQSLTSAFLNDSSFNVFDTSYDVYAIMMLWGQIPVNSKDTIPVDYDWSGKAGMNAVGRMVAIHSIQFEKGEDSLLPQESPEYISWISKTDRDVDGITCLLFIKRGIETFAESRFSFSTTPASFDIGVSRLMKFDTAIHVDNRQTLIMRSRLVYIPRCPKGFLAGSWIRSTNSGDSGVFRGLWMDETGKTIGPLTGRFWTNNDGTREFDGSWCPGMLTVIAGTIKGTWSFIDPSMCPTCGVGVGIFKGKFVDIMNNRNGTIDGFFGVRFGSGQTILPFKGVWQAICTNDSKPRLYSD